MFYAKQHKCIENRLVKHGYLDILLSTNGGILPSVNLSDLIRFKLLAAYDEVWVDATIYLTKDLDDTYFNKPVFFLNKELSALRFFCNIHKWASFFLGATVDSPYFKHLAYVFEKYLIDKNTLCIIV